MARSSRGAGRGGVRSGTPGESYTNRTDLNTALPAQAPTGLPYGEHQDLIAAQKQVPLAAAAGPADTAPSAGPTSLPAPGSNHIMNPTAYPNEPVTAGLPSGPGPGPEVLSPLGQGAFQPTVGGLLQTLAAQPTAGPAVKALAALAASGRQ